MNPQARKPPSISGVTIHQYEKALRLMKNPDSTGEVKSRSIASSVRPRDVNQIHSDAAALQSDIARKYNLPGAHNGGRVKKKTSIEPTTNSSRLCLCCGALNRRGITVCETCGFFLASTRQPAETLSQARGLVPATAKIEALSKDAWDEIEERVDSRNDAFCPICMDGFNKGHEVLLSCSHMFHRSCLQAFEKFVKIGERVCPICRTSNYQKKITHKGTKAFSVICVRQIQALWRGYQTRLKYRIHLRCFYKQGRGNTNQRKKFYEQELSCYADRVSKEIEVRRTEVDTVLHTMDQTLLESRQLDLMFENMLLERRMTSLAEELESVEEEEAAAVREAQRLSLHMYTTGDNTHTHTHGPPRPPPSLCDITSDDSGLPAMSEADWTATLLRAVERGLGDCAICMGSISSFRTTSLLSCSHLFHEQCVGNLERFCSSVSNGKEFISTSVLSE
eukprot:gene1257-2434_t